MQNFTESGHKKILYEAINILHTLEEHYKTWESIPQTKDNLRLMIEDIEQLWQARNELSYERYQRKYGQLPEDKK